MVSEQELEQEREQEREQELEQELEQEREQELERELERERERELELEREREQEREQELELEQERMRTIPKKIMRLGKCKNQTSMLRKFERLIKPIIIKRDGGKCLIAGYRHDCSPILVLDHRPSKRGNHSTFLDPRNLTTVCSNANWMAERDPFISLAIVQVVIYREGDVIEELHLLSKQIKKWSHEECLFWILDCQKHFETNKNGLPNAKT